MITCLRNFLHVEPRVLLIIGTNDLRPECKADAILPSSLVCARNSTLPFLIYFFQARTTDNMHQVNADLEAVLLLLLRQGCQAVMLTLPPVACAARSSTHWHILSAVNAEMSG